MKEFEHGGDIKNFASKVGCSVDEVIDLSSNIHFVAPKVDIDLSDTNLKSYPKYDELYQALSLNFGVDTDELEVFNGGSSAIFSLMRFLENKDCVIYAPAYTEYKKAAKLNGKVVQLVNRLINAGEDIPQDSLVVFVNPTTPEGSFYELEEMMPFWRSKNATIIIDESFLEFSEFDSMAKYINEYDKLYILRSLTKFYGCAGVRAGVVISNKENINALKSKEPLWKISAFDSLYIQKMLEDSEYKEFAKGKMQRSKEYLQYILDQAPSGMFEGYMISHGNFLMAELSNMSAAEFQEKLEPFKIMVRDCSNFDCLGENYVRIAVKSQKDLSAFEEALAQI